MAEPPKVGLTEVDRLIMRAIERGLKFPSDATRWQLISWASEALELERRDPTAFGREGFRDLTKRHFPAVNP